MNGGNGTKMLVRDRKGRMLAGVCAGIADYFGVDVTLVRVIVAVVSLITGGVGCPGLPGGMGHRPRGRREDLDRPEYRQQEAARLIGLMVR